MAEKKSKEKKREKIDLTYNICAYTAVDIRRFVKKYNILSAKEIGGIPRDDVDKWLKKLIERVGYADQFEMEE